MGPGLFEIGSHKNPDPDHPSFEQDCLWNIVCFGSTSDVCECEIFFCVRLIYMFCFNVFQLVSIYDTMLLTKTKSKVCRGAILGVSETFCTAEST